MAPFCLLPDQLAKLAQLDADKMAKMTSAQRAKKIAAVLNDDVHAKSIEDAFAKKFMPEVSPEEAAKITELAKAISDKKAAGELYGAEKVAFENYVHDLKNGIKKPFSLGRVGYEAAGLTKSVKAAWDNSAPFRQGWKAIFSHPIEWQRNTRKTFTDMWNTLGGKEVMDHLKAEGYNRENSRNGFDKAAGLALWNAEEAFPTSLPERILGIGRAYKASENAFTGFQYRMRMDLFDKYIDIAKKVGVDMSDKKELESIGKMVNSLTSRGHLGEKGEKVADVVNVLAFSGRKFKSDWDFLTAHQTQKDVSPFVRKEAVKNLAKTIAGTSGVLMLADAVAPGSVEWDSRSADFGQIKVGNTRFDVSGGMRQLPILAARLASGETKSSTTGKITKLNTGKSGAPTRAKVLGNFARSKASPIAGVVLNHLMGENFKGDPPTFLGDLSDLLEPLPSSAGRELATTNGAVPVPVGLLADMLGIGVNSYDPKQKRTKVHQPYFSLPK